MKKSRGTFRWAMTTVIDTNFSVNNSGCRSRCPSRLPMPRDNNLTPRSRMQLISKRRLTIEIRTIMWILVLRNQMYRLRKSLLSRSLAKQKPAESRINNQKNKLQLKLVSKIPRPKRSKPISRKANNLSNWARLTSERMSRKETKQREKWLSYTKLSSTIRCPQLQAHKIYNLCSKSLWMRCHWRPTW